MSNFNDMLSKAKELQAKMKSAQEMIKKIEVEGTAGGNLVSVEAKKETLDIITDLIAAAYNDAKDNLKKKSNEEISKITGGLNLPTDFKLPF